MTITANPSVRRVLATVVQDPDYRALAEKPVVSWPHIGLVGLAYGTFVGSTWAYLAGSMPLLVMLVLNQFAIYVSFTPLHDAVHESASRDERLNNLIGTVSAFLFVPGLSTTIYRILHMEHHRWVGDKHRDPDIFFVDASKPLLPLVLMTPEWIWTYWYFTKLWRIRLPKERAMFVLTLAIYVGLQAAFLLSPWAWEFVLVWLIPQKAATVVLVYFFAHIQHPAETTWERAPFQTTVQIRTRRFGKLYWLGQTDHCLHHAMPHIPFHRYHRLWKMGEGVLTRQGIPVRGLFRGPEHIEVPRQAYEAVRTARVVERREVGGAGIATFVLEGVHEPPPPGSPSRSSPSPEGGAGLSRSTRPCRWGRSSRSARHGTTSPWVGRTATCSSLEVSASRRCCPWLTICGRPASRSGCTSAPRTAPRSPSAMSWPRCPSPRPSRCTSTAPRVARRWFRPKHSVPGRRGRSSTSAGRAGSWTGSVTAPSISAGRSTPSTVNPSARRCTTSPTAGRSTSCWPAEASRFTFRPAARSSTSSPNTTPPVLAGEPEHRDAVLSPEVRAANTAMCLCVSRAKSEKIVLDL